MFKSQKLLYSNNDIVKPINGWCVDGSTLKPNPGISEYRCIDLKTGEIIFNTHIGLATNNMTEFLAIVQALILSDSLDIKTTIYSDSLNAMTWVHKRYYKTMLSRNKETEDIFELMDNAIEWLTINQYRKLNPTLWWKSKYWGEIPADYNRK